MKKKILIIEDDMNISKILRIMLLKNGFVTAAAYDAITGKTAIVANAPDLILLDISMPGGSGIEIAEFVTTNPKFSATPIIIITASGNPEVKAKAEELGVLAYLEKPFDLKKILEIINKELNVSSA
jgi:DNA-binding response OmpR family regulator